MLGLALGHLEASEDTIISACVVFRYLKDVKYLKRVVLCVLRDNVESVLDPFLVHFRSNLHPFWNIFGQYLVFF